MTEKRFVADDKYVMQNGEVYVVCGGKHSADVVATALNELLDKNEELKEEIDYFERKKYEYHKKWNITYLDNINLRKENEQLRNEKEFWKGDACNCSNYLSILSMDCQIVQEAICDLKNVIDVDTEAFKLLDELDDKFDELNQHRIKMYIR